MSTLRFCRTGIAFAMAWLLSNSIGAYGQQVPDPNFDARVAKPAYTDKHPRVLFDEAHFNLHTTSGGYKPFVDLITNDGYRVTPNEVKFDTKSLEGYDVLVISNALGAASMEDYGAGQPAFTDVECDVVRDWVRDGGCLLLIADHQPMGAAAENLGKRFGTDMSKGQTEDASNYAKDSVYLGHLMFTRENKLLGDHPITRGRGDGEYIIRVRTFTGQSLKGPDGSVVLLKLADSAIDYLTWNRRNPVSAAGRAQGIAFKFGKGRVVIFGEAG